MKHTRITIFGFLLVLFLTQMAFVGAPSTLGEKQNVKVVRRAAYLIVQNYYDQSRIKPRAMLEDGLFALAQDVPEVLPVFDGNTLHFKLAQNQISVDVAKLDHLYDILPPVSQIFAFIQNNYKGEVKLDDMEYAFVDGMLKPLDPHSRFFPPVENEDFQSETDGKYGGLGIVLGFKDYKLMVDAPMEGTPAERAGLKSGDTILQIDDYSTVNMTTQEAVDLIRGDPGTKVSL